MSRLTLRGQLAGLSTTLVLLAACAPGSDDVGAPAATGPGAHTYQVRGVLQSLPDPASGAGQLRIRHEAVPDLVGVSGEVEGMAAMTMPFPVAAEVDLAGFSPGDPIVFTLRVDWDLARPVVVTGIERLPPETVLELD